MTQLHNKEATDKRDRTTEEFSDVNTVHKSINKNTIRHTKVDWDSDNSRIILYADIMGFKAKLANTRHKDVVKELREFVITVSKHLSPYQTGGHLRMTLFSDLIVIASDSDSLKNFKLIVNAAAALLHECHTFKYPINGCIARGHLAFDEAETMTDPKGNGEMTVKIGRKGQYMPLFVGQSVVDSYLLNEDMFFYGIVLHPSSEGLLKDYTDKLKNEKLPFYRLPVPMKSGGNANLYYLDWSQIKLANNIVGQKDIREYLEDLENQVGIRPHVYIHNTLKIIETIESKKLILKRSGPINLIDSI